MATTTNNNNSKRKASWWKKKHRKGGDEWGTLMHSLLGRMAPDSDDSVRMHRHKTRVDVCVHV